MDERTTDGRSERACGVGRERGASGQDGARPAASCEPQPASRAEEVLERILSEARTKAPRTVVTGVYRDEPILKTGAQLVRERKERADRSERSREGYVAQAASPDDERWRRLMAYGEVGAGSEAGPKAARRSCAAPVPAESARTFGRAGRTTPLEGEDVPRAPRRKPDAASGLVPEWRRPARQAPLFSREDGFGGAYGRGEESPSAASRCELPPLLQELRAMEREDAAFLKSRDWLFVKQAKLAADYEDDYAYEGTFQHYFPTYQAMTDEQLRGYFSWRTLVKRGEVRRTSLSFAFVRLYELINGVGVGSPEEGFERLRAFWEAYRKEDARIDRYARTWLHDYVVYHGLDRRLFDLGRHGAEASGGQAEDEPRRRGAAVDGARSFYEALCALVASDRQEAKRRAAKGDGPKEGRGRGAGGEGFQAKGAGDAEVPDDVLFEALCAMSSYRLESSAFCKEEPELVRRAACGTWRALAAYFRAHRKRTLTESLFGAMAEAPYPMFRSAVFFGETRHEDVVYEVSPVMRYACRNGRWYEECYHSAQPNNRDLGRILKAVDRTLRRRCGSKRQLKAEAVPKYVQEIVDGVVDGLLEERAAEQEARRRSESRLEIDLSKLQGIRSAAAATREALLIDEERAEGTSGSGSRAGLGASAPPADGGSERAVEEGSAAPPREGAGCLERAAAPDAAAANEAGLSADEAAYVRCLLDGAPSAERAAVLARAGAFESVMVDAVNEKLYDLLGDVAIEDAGDGPALVEDYVEDVKGCIGL